MLECRSCFSLDDFYYQLILPEQIQFFIGCCFILWFFSVPSARFALLLFVILCIQTTLHLVETEWTSICLQMLPFEVSNSLQLLWSLLLTAQFIFSGMWGGDGRSEREIILQIESMQYR
eukprot:UN15402